MLKDDYKLTLSKYEWMICRFYAYGISKRDIALCFNTSFTAVSSAIKDSYKKLRTIGYDTYNVNQLANLVYQGVL